ncbi:MAG: hypothetical protein ACTSWY_10495 [Promethearchaeota archaeon]
MNCKACIKCKEYISLHENNYSSLQRLRKFEKAHLGHPLVTLNINEVRIFKNVNTEFDQFIISK